MDEIFVNTVKAKIIFVNANILRKYKFDNAETGSKQQPEPNSPCRLNRFLPYRRERVILARSLELTSMAGMTGVPAQTAPSQVSLEEEAAAVSHSHPTLCSHSASQIRS